MAAIRFPEGLDSNPELTGCAEAGVLSLISSISPALLSVLKDSTGDRKPYPFSPKPVGAEEPGGAEPLLGAAPPLRPKPPSPRGSWGRSPYLPL